MRYLFATGANGNGQLGVGELGAENQVSRLVPVALPDDAEIVSVAAAAFHSIAVCKEGGIYVWGCNGDGQLGLCPQEFPTVRVPKRLEIPHIRATKCATSATHSLLLTENGDVFTLRADGAHAASVPEPIAQIFAGSGVSFAITTVGAVYGWGDSTSGMLGGCNLPIPHVSEPTLLDVGPPGTRIERIAAGDDHTVFLTTSGTVLCSGGNAHGQLGLEGAPHATSWRPLRHSHHIRDISVGHSASYFITGEGRPSMVGAMTVGDEVRKHHHPELFRPGIAECGGIAAGKNHVVVWSCHGEVRATGRNHRGQLGNGHTGDAHRFVRVPLPQSKKGVKLTAFDAACGAAHTLVLASDEHILCMGFFTPIEDDPEYSQFTQWEEGVSNMSFTRGTSVSRSFATPARPRAGRPAKSTGVSSETLLRGSVFALVAATCVFAFVKHSVQGR